MTTQQVELLIGWGIPQTLASIALRDAQPNQVSALDAALEHVGRLWGFCGAAGMIGASEVAAPEDKLETDHWATVTPSGCLAMHQRTQGVDNWMESPSTVVRLLQLPVESVGWQPGSTRIQLEGPVLLEPRTQVLLDSAAAPANLFIEASSPEDAEFWLKVLNWDAAAERATAPEDANRAGPLWVTEFDMVGSKHMQIKKWAVLTNTELKLLPMPYAESLDFPYNDQTELVLGTELLDVGTVEEDGELRGPSGQIAGTLRLIDPDTRRTVDLYHPNVQELQLWHNQLQQQHEQLIIDEQRAARNTVANFQNQMQPDENDGGAPEDFSATDVDLSMVCPPAFTSPLALAVTHALLKFAKSTGQAFASGAFLVHDSFQDEDHALFNILHSDPARYARVSRHLQNVAPPHAWFSRKPLLYGIDIDEISYEVLPKTQSECMDTVEVNKRSIMFCKLNLNGRPLLYIKPTAQTAPQRERACKNGVPDEKQMPEFVRSEMVPLQLIEWFNSKVEAVGLVPVEACRAAKAGVFAMVELLEEAARGAESNKAASDALTELQLHLQENIKSKLESADVRNGLGWSKTQTDDVLARVWHVYDLENKPENTFKFRIGEEVYVPHRVTADIMNGIETHGSANI